MIISKVLGNAAGGLPDKRIERIGIEWFERSKKLLSKVTEKGESVGIRLSEPLKDGDILFEDVERVVVAEFLPCELLQINVGSMEEMGRLCFEFGNRHMSIEITPSAVTSVWDGPMSEHLSRLGFCCHRKTGKFTNYLEVKAHDHVEHDHAEHDHGVHAHGEHEHGHSHG